MIKFISYVNLISICLIILFKTFRKLLTKFFSCFDIITLLAFHVSAAYCCFMSIPALLSRIVFVNLKKIIY